MSTHDTPARSTHIVACGLQGEITFFDSTGAKEYHLGGKVLTHADRRFPEPLEFEWFIETQKGRWFIGGAVGRDHWNKWMQGIREPVYVEVEADQVAAWLVFAGQPLPEVLAELVRAKAQGPAPAEGDGNPIALDPRADDDRLPDAADETSGNHEQQAATGGGAPLEAEWFSATEAARFTRQTGSYISKHAVDKDYIKQPGDKKIRRDHKGKGCRYLVKDLREHIRTDGEPATPDEEAEFDARIREAADNRKQGKNRPR